jgi:hypothetical protein
MVLAALAVNARTDEDDRSGASHFQELGFVHAGTLV